MHGEAIRQRGLAARATATPRHACCLASKAVSEERSESTPDPVGLEYGYRQLVRVVTQRERELRRC